MYINWNFGLPKVFSVFSYYRFIRLEKIMEEEVKKSAPSRKMLAIIVILVVIMLISSFVWYSFLRPVSIREMIGQNPQDGDIVKISDVIYDIDIINTSYGQFQYLTLGDDSLWFIVCEDMSENYTIGDRYQTTFHFQDYWFNQNRILGAPELMGPHLYLAIAMETVQDDISAVGGYYLELNSSEAGYLEYRVVHNSTGVPLSEMNVSLRAGSYFGPVDVSEDVYIYTYAVEYVNFISGYEKEQEIDYMASLENQTSDNETIEFVDVNANSLLDTGDIFRLHIPPTTNESIVTTYQLMIGGGMSSQGINDYYGVKYIINWNEGPVENIDRNLDFDWLSA